MLAKHYSYWISEEPASGNAATYLELESRRFDLSQDSFSSLVRWGSFLSVSGLLFAGFLDLGPVFRFIGFVLLGLGFGLILGTIKPYRDRVVARQMEERAGQNPWQSWPCRMETTKEFHILDRQGKVVGTFQNITQLPDELPPTMTNGIGVFWLCGDLGEEVMVALPGGKIFWRAQATLTRKDLPSLAGSRQTAVSVAVRDASEPPE